VAVELKSVEKTAPVHAKQVLTQCRLSDRRLGLLINFGEVHLKDGIKRIANGLPEESDGGLIKKFSTFILSFAAFAFFA